MKLNRRIIAALSPLGLPAAPDVELKNAKEYIVFNYDLLPVQFVGNKPIYWRALIQVHYFCPLGADRVAERGRIPGLLADAGFTWPEIVDATDKTAQHYVYETETICEIEEE